MKIIFLGTPEFSVPSLKAIHESNHELIAIVSQPDRVSMRGNKVVFSPVKQYAIENDIPILQFDKISRDGVESLKSLEPDLMVTASFGQILSQEVIDIPKYGIINVHASLLPHYRGASPIQTAILNGDTETGVTIMKTEAGLDTGDIIKTKTVQILPDETAGELSIKLAKIGSEVLLDVIEEIENGTVESYPQPHIDAKVTRRIHKEEGKIVWEQSAKEIKSKILAYNPSPVAFAYLKNEQVKIYRAVVADNSLETSEPAGTILEASSPKKGVFVQCGSGVLELLEVQFPNSKVGRATDAMNGRKLSVGDRFVYDETVVLKEPNILK